MTPLVLLVLVFAVGTGQSFTAPARQTLQPELVRQEERTQPITLGAVNLNRGRAAGPAIGGALDAATSAGAPFAVNAASFVTALGVLFRWRGGARPHSGLAPEQVGEAMRAGARYVAASPALRVVQLRPRCRRTRAGARSGSLHGSRRARPNRRGVAWILVLSTLNSVFQSTLPAWAKARGMAYCPIVFQGAGASGAADR